MNDLRYSAILERGVLAASGPLLALSLYLLFAGHNRPGGGFAGGLVAAVVVVLAWSAGGSDTVSRVLPMRATALMGAGLVVASITGLVPLFSGLGFLESGYAESTLPGFGTVKVVSALFFDIGVYLVVVGMALGLVRALGRQGVTLSTGEDTE